MIIQLNENLDPYKRIIGRRFSYINDHFMCFSIEIMQEFACFVINYKYVVGFETVNKIIDSKNIPMDAFISLNVVRVLE